MSSTPSSSLACTLGICGNNLAFAKALAFLTRLRVRMLSECAANHFVWLPVAVGTGISTFAVIALMGSREALSDVVFHWNVFGFIVTSVYFVSISRWLKAIKIVIGIMLGTMGTFYLFSFWVGHSELFSSPISHQVLGFATSLGMVAGACTSLARYRFTLIAPDNHRLNYLKNIYLPLFSQNDNCEIFFSPFSIDPEPLKIPDYKPRKYAFQTTEQLFSSNWQLSNSANMELKHFHTRIDVYNVRKNKYKGVVHQDQAQITLTSAKINKTMAATIEADLRKTVDTELYLSLKTDKDKLKLTLGLQFKSKSTDSKANKKLDFLKLIPEKSIHATIRILTSAVS